MYEYKVDCKVYSFRQAYMPNVSLMDPIPESSLSSGPHLDLNVTRVIDEFLDQHAIVTEAGFRLIFRQAESLTRLLIIPSDPHALAATASRGLNHHGITCNEKL